MPPSSAARPAISAGSSSELIRTISSFVLPVRKLWPQFLDRRAESETRCCANAMADTGGATE